MPQNTYFPYIIVGGGTAGASAVDGIREVDKDNPILLIGEEEQLPYNRPPLTKDLWLGGKQEEIYVHDARFYEKNGVTLALESRVVSVDTTTKSVTDARGNSYRYRKLLLATGALPRRLTGTGGVNGIIYYRTFKDYESVRATAQPGTRVLMIGGGFIGTELASSLAMNGVAVTMIYPDAYLASKVLPASVGRELQDEFVRRGVEIFNPDKPRSFAKQDGQYITHTQDGREIETHFIIAGIGIVPSTKLAEATGLETGDGIMVNERLETSDPDIYAAGDNALFPDSNLGGKRMRLEHWDNAQSQGRLAGRNMAGAGEAFTYEPAFFSKMFNVFEFWGIGEINARLRTVAEWERKNEAGTIYYIDGERLVGLLYCNVPARLTEARELLKKGEVPSRFSATV